MGLEAAIIDHGPMDIAGFPGDERRISANVAGPAALLVAKLHKLAEREEQPDRLFPKDAQSKVTADAIRFLESLFAAGPDALGSRMAGQAEAGVGEPATTAQACSFLASDVLAAVS